MFKACLKCVAVEKRESKSHKEQSKKKNGAMHAHTVPTDGRTYLLLAAEVSGKKRGAAVSPGRKQERGRGEEEERGHLRGRSGARPVIVGEEEGQRLWGEEEGRRLSSSLGKKMGGGCCRHRGRRGAVAVVVIGFV
jgi:hypothetical protein